MASRHKRPVKLDAQCNLEVRGRSIALDRSGSDVCFVSHAHSDHTSALKGRTRSVLASDATLALAGNGTHGKAELDGLEVELLASGHMLGSRQLRVETADGSFTYTGDFKLGKSLTAEPAEIRETDTLMIEGTFGDPRYAFPDREHVVDGIAEFVTRNHDDGHIVLLGGYTLGKAQELVAIVNRRCHLTPVVSERIADACGIYSLFGVPLDAAGIGSHDAEEIMRDAFVAVMPFHQVNFDLAVKLSRAYHKSVYSAVATGWAASTRFPVDEAFPLSDHADFNEIVQYVQDAKPKTVYCCHGNEQALSRELQKRGFNATPARDGAFQTCLGGL